MLELLKRWRNPFSKRNALLKDGPWWTGYQGGTSNSAGVSLTEEDKLGLTPVLAALRIIADDVALLPLSIEERATQGRRKHRLAVNHRLYEMVHSRPNPEQTKFEFFRMLLMNLLWTWNGYVQLIHDQRGQVIEMWPLFSPNMRVERMPNGELIYPYRVGSGEHVFRADEIIHFKGAHSGGLVPKGPLQLHTEALGGAVALQEYANRFFGQGVNGMTIFTYPGRMKEPEKKAFREHLDKSFSGLNKSHRWMAVAEGEKIEHTATDPEAAQALESRRYVISEVARMYRIPPHMLMDMDRATFSNIEHQRLEYMQGTLMPWLELLRQGLASRLFTPADRKRFELNFNMDKLLQADSKTRWETHQIGVLSGTLTRNEVRDIEGYNPIDGLDEPLNPANITGNQKPPGNKPEPTVDGDPDTKATTGYVKRTREEYKTRALPRVGLRGRFEALILSDAERLVKREVREVRKAAKRLLSKRSAKGFEAWVKQFYADFPETVKNGMGPIFATYAATIADATGAELGITAAGAKAFSERYLESFADDYAGRSSGQLAKLMQGASEEDALSIIEGRMEEWVEKKPSKIAKRQAVQLEGAVALNTMRGGGVTKIMWNAVGENCPFCDELDGQIVGVEENFADKGATIGSEDDQGIAHVYRAPANIMHPPLHEGCDCFLSPA